MIIAVILFSISLGLLNHVEPFESDPLEVIVIGGAILGIGAGLIIRYGGCLDGTEIMAIIINRKKGLLLDRSSCSSTSLSLQLMAQFSETGTLPSARSLPM